MTSQTGNKAPRARASRRPLGGFTLVELILVLAMLAAVVALAAPRLARFFRGRNLESEAWRLLGLTRYGQSRAVADGMPMVLWIDTAQSRYGMRAETGYLETDPKSVQFTLAEDLELQVEPLQTRLQSDWRQTPSTVAGNLPFIRFRPDGFIDESSREWLLLREKNDEGAVWIALGRNRLNYEIQTNFNPVVRR
jgi:type II secretion system protein H